MTDLFGRNATPALLALVAAGGLLTPSPALAAGQQGDLRPMQPVVCSGSDDIVIAGRSIVTDGNGIEILGACDVIVRNSRIVAGGVGILISQNGEVEITDSHVEGGIYGLQVVDNGQAHFGGSTILGGTSTAGNGRLTDRGGNRFEAAAGVRVEDGRDTQVTVGEGGVTVSDAGGNVTIGPGGIVSDRSGVVSVEGGYVRIESGGNTVEIDPDWRTLRATTYDTSEILVELGAVEEAGEIHIDMAGDVLFDYDSAEIRPDAAEQLAMIAHVLRDRATGQIEVIGHTDSRGTDEYNQALSEARAIAVMRWLNERQGIPLQLMRGKGMGASEPLDYNTMPDGSDNPEGRARNRRVEIRFAAGR